MTLQASRILLVEDNPSDARLVEILLEEVGARHNLTRVSSMAAALRALTDDTFDCALLDLGLPDGHGLENIERLISVAPKLPIVVMTGLNDDRTVDGAKAYGARGYLVKGSVDTGAALEARIRSILSDDAQRTPPDPGTTSGDGFEVDLDGRVIDWSPAAAELSGYAADEVLGEPVARLVPADRVEELDLIERRMRSGHAVQGFETARLHKNGAQRIVHLSAAPTRNDNDEITGYRVHEQDITELKRHRADAMQLAAIFESTADIIIATTLDERITHWNPGARRTLGYAEDEIVGRPLRNLVPSNGIDWLQAQLEETRRGHRIDRFDTRLRHRNGQEVDVSTSFVPMRDHRGGISGLVVVATDITERKRSEAALREGSERTRAIVETVPDSIITIDDSGLIESINPAAERLFGYADDELVGRNVNVLMPDPYASEHDGYIARYLRTGERRIIGIGREVRARKKNGDVFPIELAVGEVRLGERRLFTGVIRDITARKQAEAALEREVAERAAANDGLRETLRQLQEAQGQLVQAEKLASLGGLVAGVAHEINTPVGVAVTAASHLHSKTAELQSAYDAGTLRRSDLTGYMDHGRQATEIILTNLRRAAELIHSFKQVAVDQSSSERRRFKVREYLEETLVSLRPKLKSTAIHVALECDEDLTLDSVPGAFSQILTNLIMNSLLHAYEPGERGTIRITAEADEAGFRLAYRDDGKGMPAEILAQIYDPFFTTRRGSGGTGLGMHVVYNLITRKLGGQVEMDSRPGEGMCFEMRLPATFEEAIR